MPRTLYLFGDCRLDVAARALWRDGARVDLPPIVFDCIAYLVTQRERAVGRDELVAAVWGKNAISDTMLGKAILAARRAIGDSAEAQASIRTIPRFGYHWVGAVREATSDGNALPDAVPPSEDTRGAAAIALRPQPSPRQRLRNATVVVLLLALACAGLFVLQRRAFGPSSMQTHASADAVAATGICLVLPVDVVGASDDAWLRLGMMDLIANRLRAAGLAVMSSDSVVSLLKQQGASAASAAAAVRRDDARAHVIEVALARNGDDWALHAQVDADGHEARAIDVHAVDAVSAARLGADRIIELLGKRVPDTRAAHPLALDALLEQTEAARLSDHLEIARALLANASPAVQALPDVRLRSAQIELRAGEFEHARGHLSALLAELPPESDPVLRARVLNSLSNAQGQLEQPRAAIASASEAIRLVESLDAPEPLAIAYNNRAITHARQREFDEADADFARARVAFERSGDRIALIRLDGNTASVAVGRGRPAEALPILLRAGQRFEQFGLFNEALIAITNQVDAYRALLQSADALAASERGWSMLAHVQDRNLLHHFKGERAQALAANGRIAEAHALLEELIGSIDANADAPMLGLSQSSQADLEFASGQFASASVLAAQAMAALPTPEYQQPRAATALTEIRSLRKLGRTSEANAELTRLRNWADDAHAPMVSVYAELAAAGALASAGSAAAADAHYEQAQTLASELNLPYVTAKVALAQGAALIGAGELERATVVVGRVARYAETDFDCALLQARLYLALGQHDAWQSALARARALAGERAIPDDVSAFPSSARVH